MKISSVIFFIIITIFTPLSVIASGAQSALELRAVVAENVLVYFDGQNIVAKTNSNGPLLITKTSNNDPEKFIGAQQKNQAPVAEGLTYIIVPSL